jgi:hypothetical protein
MLVWGDALAGELTAEPIGFFRENHGVTTLPKGERGGRATGSSTDD